MSFRQWLGTRVRRALGIEIVIQSLVNHVDDRVQRTETLLLTQLAEREQETRDRLDERTQGLSEHIEHFRQEQQSLVQELRKTWHAQYEGLQNALAEKEAALRASVQEQAEKLAPTVDASMQEVAAVAAQVSALHQRLDAMAAEVDEKLENVNTFTQHRANEVFRWIDDLKRIVSRENYDILAELRKQRDFAPKPTVRLETEHPLALDSDDHKFPWGTQNDNTRQPRFVSRCEEVFGRKLHALDLGCAGGGLVLDFLLAGHLAVGLEGSDHCRRSRHGAWRVIPEFLHTCDVAKPFRFVDEASGQTAKFDVISAWELLEHIPEDSLPILLENIREHLAEDGLFVASVATTEDTDPETGAVYHVTIHDRPWWETLFAHHGLRVVDGPFQVSEYARGSGNVVLDWSVLTHPERGFHLTARL